MSIKQAIEALEKIEQQTEHGPQEYARAALAALRSMPQGEPVARDWVASLKIDMEASAWDGVIQLDDALKNIDDALAATPHTEAVRMSEAEINHLVDTHVGGPTPSYPLGPEDWINFARAVEQATAARLGVKMGDV